jgi:diguanylate cyclase (GGDEF)-like protein
MDIAAEASKARAVGDLTRAIDLYGEAEEQSGSRAELLYLMMRRAYCLLDDGQKARAIEIAHTVSAEAREKDVLPSICDAIGLLVDDHMLNDRLAEATRLLAEARYLLDQLPNDQTAFLVVYNLAVTYERCDFPASALELFDRALRLVTNSDDRTFVQAGMAAAYHLAMMNEPDAEAREGHIENGIRVSTDVIECDDDIELVAVAGAYAHRAVLLNAQAHHETALVDALAARDLAEAHNFNTELVVALLGEAVARWNLHRDPVCIELIEKAWRIAEGPWVRRFPVAAWPVEVEALWATGRYEDARQALVRRQAVLEQDLRRERAARLAHVQLGVEHRHTERISETDPLTGLYNRRYLARLLPDALERFGPICVAVFDLDGFKRVNDSFTYEQGDRVLQEMAAVLHDSCRSGDCVARLGGDEFVMVLTQITPPDARVVLDRVRELIAATTWTGMPSRFTLTTSVGVAIGTSVYDAHRVISEASAALQMAKRSGRNQIVFH